MIACGFTLVNIPVPMKTAPHLKGAVPFKGSITMITIFCGLFNVCGKYSDKAGWI